LEFLNDAAYGPYINLTDGIVELKITIGYGPRIFYYGLHGGSNHFYTDEEAKYTVEEVEHDLYGKGPWKLRGGHRLGIAPEVYPGSVYPDNAPVTWKAMAGGVSLQSEVETWTSLQKRLEISFSGCPGEISIKHEVCNRGDQPVTLSVWPITAMAPGGLAIIPQPESESNPLPNRSIALWSYGSCSDSRVAWGDRYITVRQLMQPKWKFGCYNPKGWLAYINRNEVFIKRFKVMPEAVYPDRGSTCEVFTNEDFLELESLSPLQTIMPGSKLYFQETWLLQRTELKLSEGMGVDPTRLEKFGDLMSKL
jgi:hypothetical protein